MKLSWLKVLEDESPPVLFLHGFMGQGADWDFTQANFPFSTCTVDLPGHASNLYIIPDEIWFDQTTLQIKQALDEAGIERVHLVGYSMGGRVGLCFAERFPEMVVKIVLESSHPGLALKSERVERFAHDTRWALRLENEWPKVLEAWYEQPVFQSFQGERKMLIEKRSANLPSNVSKALLGFSLAHQPKMAPLHSCLFIAGESDLKYVSIGNDLVRFCSTVAIKVVEGAGHNVHLEQPEQYLALITQFLE